MTLSVCLFVGLSLCITSRVLSEQPSASWCSYHLYKSLLGKLFNAHCSIVVITQHCIYRPTNLQLGYYIVPLLCVGCVWQPPINEHDNDDETTPRGDSVARSLWDPCTSTQLSVRKAMPVTVTVNMAGLRITRRPTAVLLSRPLWHRDCRRGPSPSVA